MYDQRQMGSIGNPSHFRQQQSHPPQSGGVRPFIQILGDGSVSPRWGYGGVTPATQAGDTSPSDGVDDGYDDAFAHVAMVQEITDPPKSGDGSDDAPPTWEEVLGHA